MDAVAAGFNIFVAALVGLGVFGLATGRVDTTALLPNPYASPEPRPTSASSSGPTCVPSPCPENPPVIGPPTVEPEPEGEEPEPDPLPSREPRTPRGPDDKDPPGLEDEDHETGHADREQPPGHLKKVETKDWAKESKGPSPKDHVGHFVVEDEDGHGDKEDKGDGKQEKDDHGKHDKHGH